ncbi:hypothetical protein Droror1_Dr00012525 [Drosera rotundifolia]
MPRLSSLTTMSILSFVHSVLGLNRTDRYLLRLKIFVNGSKIEAVLLNLYQQNALHRTIVDFFWPIRLTVWKVEVITCDATRSKQTRGHNMQVFFGEKSYHMSGPWEKKRK